KMKKNVFFLMRAEQNILYIMKEKMQYNFIDLFCGAGGFAKGFEMTGKFKCIGGIDNKASAMETHKYNFKDSVSICEDIRNVPPKDFEELLKGQKVDLIIGGP